MAGEGREARDGLRSMPPIELVSRYMNGFGGPGAEGRAAIAAELERRGIPLPELPDPEAPAPRASPDPEPKPRKGLDSGTFLSYVLLIYTLTGAVYSWIFLAARLLGKDIGKDPRHRAIQTLICFGYLAAEAAVLAIVGAE